MTRDEIIRLASEAELWGDRDSADEGGTGDLAAALVTFAGLVESAQEIKAQSAYSRGYACGIAAGDVSVEHALKERDDAVKALDAAYGNGAAAGVKLERLKLLRIAMEVAPAFGMEGERMALAVRARILRVGD